MAGRAERGGRQMKSLRFPSARATDAGALHPWARNAAVVTAALGFLFLLLLALVYWLNWARYERAREQIESRIARLDGVLASSAEIDARLARARRSISPWLHQGGDAGQNAILQRLRDLVVSSGATLISSQAATVPAESERKLPKVRVSATVSGEWAQLVQLSAALQAQRPPYLVHSLNIQREGQAGNKAVQKARMTLQLDVPLAESSATKPVEPKP